MRSGARANAMGLSASVLRGGALWAGILAVMVVCFITLLLSASVQDDEKTVTNIQTRETIYLAKNLSFSLAAIRKMVDEQSAEISRISAKMSSREHNSETIGPSPLTVLPVRGIMEGEEDEDVSEGSDLETKGTIPVSVVHETGKLSDDELLLALHKSVMAARTRNDADKLLEFVKQLDTEMYRSSLVFFVEHFSAERVFADLAYRLAPSDNSQEWFDTVIQAPAEKHAAVLAALLVTKPAPSMPSASDDTNNSHDDDSADSQIGSKDANNSHDDDSADSQIGTGVDVHISDVETSHTDQKLTTGDYQDLITRLHEKVKMGRTKEDADAILHFASLLDPVTSHDSILFLVNKSSLANIFADMAYRLAPDDKVQGWYDIIVQTPAQNQSLQLKKLLHRKSAETLRIASGAQADNYTRR